VKIKSTSVILGLASSFPTNTNEWCPLAIEHGCESIEKLHNFPDKENALTLQRTSSLQLWLGYGIIFLAENVVIRLRSIKGFTKNGATKCSEQAGQNIFPCRCFWKKEVFSVATFCIVINTRHDLAREKLTFSRLQFLEKFYLVTVTVKL